MSYWTRNGLANRLVRLLSGGSSGEGNSGTRNSNNTLIVGEDEDDEVVVEGGRDDSDDSDFDYDTTTDNDDEEGEDEEFNPAPVMDPPEITDQLPAGSSLRHDLITARSTKFPACLTARELGLISRIKAIPASHLLPRKRDQVAMIRAKVFCGSFDQRTGDHFISAAQDCLIRVYDTSVGKFKLSKTIIAQEVGWSILDCVISPTSDHLLYTSWSPVIRLVNYQAGPNGNQCHQEPLMLDTHTANIGFFSVRYSPNGQEVIAGASDHCVYIYDLESRKQVLRIRAQDNDVNAVSFLDEGSNIMCSGGDDGLLKVWDRRQLVERRAKPVGMFSGHYDGITFIDARGDNRHLISNSKDQTIKLWDMRSFASKSGIAESKALTLSGQWDYRWAPVPRRVTMNRDRMLGDTSIMTYRGHTVRQTLIRCHFSPAHSTGQRYIYTGCASGNVFIYDALTGEIVSELSSHMQNCRDVSWHPFFPELISSSWDGSIVKWSYADDDILTEEDRQYKRSRRFSSSTQYMASRRHAHQYREFDDL